VSDFISKKYQSFGNTADLYNHYSLKLTIVFILATCLPSRNEVFQKKRKPKNLNIHHACQRLDFFACLSAIYHQDKLKMRL